jgi:alpha-amylase
VHLQDNARVKGVYAARVVGRNGYLYVRIGSDDASWQPFHSGYENYREYARGSGWQVWVALQQNPEMQQAPLKAALLVPDYKEPQTIGVSDILLN